MDQSTGYDGELSSAAKYGQSRVFRTLDKLDASQNLLEEVIAEQKRHGKGCDVGTSYVLNEIGNLLLRRGLNEEASLRYRESIEIKEKILGPMHLDVLGSKRNEALVQAKMGKVDFATTFIEINVLMPQRQHPPTADRDIEVAKTMELLVQLYRRQGVYQKALQSCQEVLRLREKGAGLHDESILVTRMTLCRLLIATGDIESAKRQYEEVSQLVEKLQLTREHALTRQLGKVVTLIEEAAQKKEGQSEKKNAWFFPFSRNKIVASQ
jgi:tetratricopeptide (TPR) repeat protein